MPGASALVVRVPEAEPVVASLRQRFDPSAKLGVPAHVTILFPFMAPERITKDVLRRAGRACGGVRPFDFVLSKVQRWPETMCLLPEPPQPFVELTRTMVRQFPDFPPYSGRHQGTAPHLTVADGSAEVAALAEAELRSVMAQAREIRATCREIELLENATGTWRTMSVISLNGS